MNFCDKCRNPLKNENIFCSKCGHKIDSKNNSILGVNTSKDTQNKAENNKGKSSDRIQKNTDNNPTSKILHLLNYIKNRKKNILIFILLALFLKPVIHYTFFNTDEEFVNYDRKLLFGSNNTNTYKKDTLGNLIYYGVTARRNRFSSPFGGVAIYTKEGEIIINERGGSGQDAYTNYYFYTKEIRTASFKTSLNAMFTQKKWIFLISILSILIAVFLMNDKLKAK